MYPIFQPHSRKLLIAVLALLFAVQASASLSLERSTLVQDDQGGSFSAQTSGTLDIPGSDLITTASFSAFHPGSDNQQIDGEVVRARVRHAEGVLTTLNGSLLFTGVGQDNNEPISLQFNDLVIERDAVEIELSGSVTVNGEFIDAAEMPGKVRAILRRVLRFLRYD
ncbi:MAG: hypothetical protein Tsb002_23540 [Wenzhouxiangellaceae bacterium]